MASSSSSSAATGDVAESSAAAEARERASAGDVAESSAAAEAREAAAAVAGDVAESSAAAEARQATTGDVAESSAAAEAREEAALAGEVSALAVTESSGRKITLRSSDGELFVIDEAAAVQSEMLKNMIDDDCVGSAIPLLNVTGRILAKVVEWLQRHVEAEPKALVATGDKAAEKAAAELKEWEAEYVKVDKGTLYQLILAANYMNIKDLMDRTCLAVADLIRGKSPDEIREILGIKNTYTKEEEEEVRRENAWAFE